ncbi:MAG: DUF4097 family beta strand repeat-containing protein [Gemmatimonadota bacterium]
MKTIGVMALAAAGLMTVTGSMETPPVGNLFEMTPATQHAQDWEWQGNVDRGDAIEIKGINGGIKASGASGGQVTVSAIKKGKDDDPADVRIEVVEHSGGVTICAVYPDADGKKNECAPGDGGRLSSKDNDVSVSFTVQVPAGVRFVGTTVNGDIEAGNLEADVLATTVNGGVKVSTSGLAKATTVNGSIQASMGRADWGGTLSFNTVNGSITVNLPQGVNTEVSASTVNGSMETDFPLTIKGRFSMKNMHGTIGSGGRELEMETVNGSIHLKSGG